LLLSYIIAYFCAVKVWFRPLIAGLLALSVMVSTTGATFHRHFCLIAVERTCDLQPPAGEDAPSCCGIGHNESDCCTAKLEFRKTDVSPVSALFQWAMAWALLPTLPSSPAAQLAFGGAIVVSSPSVPDTSPPLPGQKIVILHQAFLL